MNKDFEVKIELGSETMGDGLDLASALRKIASKIATGQGFSGIVLDDCGNSVGHYRLYPMDRDLKEDRS